jgi:hypothetical protein
MKRDTVFVKLTALWNDRLDPENQCHETVIDDQDTPDNEVVIRTKRLGNSTQQPRNQSRSPPKTLREMQLLSERLGGGMSDSTTSLVSNYSLPDLSKPEYEDPLFNDAGNGLLSHLANRPSSNENLSLGIFNDEDAGESVIVYADDTLPKRDRAAANAEQKPPLKTDATPQIQRSMEWDRMPSKLAESSRSSLAESLGDLLNSTRTERIVNRLTEHANTANRAKRWISDRTHPLLKPFLIMALVSLLVSVWTTWRFNVKLNSIAYQLNVTSTELTELLRDDRYRHVASEKQDWTTSQNDDWLRSVRQQLRQVESQHRDQIRQKLRT